MFELKQKVIKVAATFLDRRGYEVIDTEWEPEDGGYIDVVARDEDASTGTTRTTWTSPSASTASRCWSSARTVRS